MKILFACNELRGGGVESVILTLANYFISLNIEVHLIIFNTFKEIEINPLIKLHIIDGKKYHKSKKLKLLIYELEKNSQFDLILSNQTETDYFMKKINHKNIYFIIHVAFSHNYLNNKSIFKNLRRQFRFKLRYKNLKIISVCNGVKNDFINNLKIKPYSIKTIYNPINIDYLNILSNQESIIKEKNYIVHVANYGEMKRHDIIIKAYKLSNIEEKLVLVGANIKNNMLNLVKELDMEDKVIFTGFIQNPYPIIKNAKLLVSSSDHEGFGMTLIEALALKTLVISTNYSYGANEILVDELSKYLVETNDYQALSDKIRDTIFDINNNKLAIDFDKFIDRFKVENIGIEYLKLI